jgi:hypothetical protein
MRKDKNNSNNFNKNNEYIIEFKPCEMFKEETITTTLSPIAQQLNIQCISKLDESILFIVALYFLVCTYVC